MRVVGWLSALMLMTAGPALALPGGKSELAVRTQAGVVRGSVEKGVASWLGVPYAAAPVGDLRWRPPQPAKAWTGERDATRMSPDCVQGRMPSPPGAPAAPVAAQSEDCLYLNLWRPAGEARKLPVLVWVHGGAFVNGGSSSPETWGDALARRGVVVVTFNYRLGRLGFFGHPALSAEHPEEGKGNYGLMDQVAALTWVRQNIGRFGGDPRNVTVMGGSAGGISINLLLGSPKATGLFEKAAVQSGAGRDLLGRERRLSQDLPGAPSAEQIGLAFAQKQGVTGSDAAALAALRALPAERITGDLSMLTLVFSGAGALHAGPVVDGRVVAVTPEAMFRSRSQRPVPMIVGATTADLSLERAATADEAFARFGPAADRARAAYDPNGNTPVVLLNRAIGGDRNMVEPARFMARSMSALGQPVYAYRFGYVAQARRAASPWGADHSSEVAYVFDRLAALNETVSPSDQAVADQMASYWVNFARTGNPNTAGAPSWPAFTAASDRLLFVGPDGSFRGVPDPWRTRLDLAEELSAQR